MKLVKLGTYYKSMVFYNKLFSRLIEIQSVVSCESHHREMLEKGPCYIKVEYYRVLLIPARPVNDALPPSSYTLI